MKILVAVTAAFLVFGAALSSWSGLPGCGDETDGDGVCMLVDNCLFHPNGPALGTGSCDDQEDADSDGYGNICDTDQNNNGATDVVDVNDTLNAFLAGELATARDYNCNGAVDVTDVNRALNDFLAGTTPGPSGYACAGTVPCP